MRKVTIQYLLASALLHNTWLSKYIPDELYLKILYRGYVGKKLNLDCPRSYNEKLQWLKIYDRKPEYTKMVDKYEVKKYVADKIGEEFIIPTIGVWERFDDINFDVLPKQFVLKCTHDSGGIVICKDKESFDYDSARKLLEKNLRKQFFFAGREWPYKNVKPRIIAEQYMEDGMTNELRDYKFLCFSGVAKALFVASNRQNKEGETRFDFFDMDYNVLPFTNGRPHAEKVPEKPKNFEEMKRLAEILSAGIPQIRVDFYEVDGKIYFGELTFFWKSGFVPFVPDEWDYNLGDWIELPNKIENDK